MDKKTNDNKIEREYIIPLRRRWKIVPRYKRTNKAVRTVKEFLVRHMKIRDRDLDKIRIDKYLNEVLWSRGIRNPPSKIKVKAIKEGDIVRVEAAELPANIKFKKTRREKIESSAKEIAKKKKTEKAEVEEAKDENKDGVEDKKAEEEKKESVIEAGKEMEKAVAKTEKHTTKVKAIKEQQAIEKKVYNKQSR